MRTNAAGGGQLSPAAVAVPARSAKRQGLRWFVRAPARMALDRGVSAVAFRLATVLLHYEGELGCFPSQERLSDDLGMSVDSVQRYLRELELYGFLVVEKRGRRNNYRLEPLYEAPIGHGSIEETGQLEVENQSKRRPPSPRSLRSRPLVAKAAEEAPPQSAAPVRSIGSSRLREQLAAPVRPIEAADRAPSTALVRSVNAAPLRSKAVEAPHGCGTNKKHSNIKNQHQQDASEADVGEDIEENDYVTDAIASLQRVGVSIVSADLGLHAGRGRRLLHLELLEWATWVQSAEKNGIANKTAFAASKVRLGFTVGDAFPNLAKRALRDREQQLASAQKAEAEDATEEIHRERSRLADALIGSLDAESRQDLRAKALSDPAAWIGRNVSSDMFDRLVTAVERRIVIDETQRTGPDRTTLESMRNPSS